MDTLTGLEAWECLCPECGDNLVEGIFGSDVCLRCEGYPGEPNDYVLYQPDSCWSEALQ